MANKTVYPYGTDGSLPSSIGIINDLRTGGADKALSAEQGKFIGELLMKGELIDLSLEYKYVYFIDGENKWFHATDSNNVRCCLIPIAGAKYFQCTAVGGYCTFSFLKSTTREDGATPDFADGYEGRFSIADGSTGIFDIPSDANFLYVYAQTASGTDITTRYGDFTIYYSYLDKISEDIDSETVREIYPSMIYYIPSTSESDNKGKPSQTYYGTTGYSTARFIAVLDNTIYLTVGKTGTYRMYEYGEDFSYLGSFVGEITADTKTGITLANKNTKYIKIRFATVDDGDAKTTVKVEGKFPVNWDVFNVRNDDGGYQKIAVSVRVTVPTCCDDDDSVVQDASQMLTDYGLICLPSKYSNTGKPTRMIIYCHGAAVNYASDVSRFNSVDLEPDYWLAEGYAVMDIEGNPFNNADEHFCIPQAMDCYVAAYKWAIEFYNICRDGVLVGGRSMGGAMTFDLIREQCQLPIIAACPNVPWSSVMGQSSRVRKLFWATHCGFNIPSGYSFGDATYTSGDKQVFLDNFDKLIKNNPVMCGVANTPVSSEEKQSFIDCYTSQSAERKALWETYRMKAKCPVKLFGCNQDETCPPQYTSALLYQMLINGAQIAELRLFNSYKDYTGTGTSAHHYDTQDPALRADITTSYGEELEDVPIVYIEMLAFWRRYEQGL